MTATAARFPVWPDQGADAMERELLARWKAEDLFGQVQEARKDGKPFVFYEGPPTANGRPGIHHVFSRTIKDLFPRFRVMQGHSVTRIAGWDTHGLPVEIEIEKKLALKGKKDIEAYGVAEFNRLCRESVFTYVKDWQELSDRIGYSLDYEHPYITCTPQYIESVWWLLKQLHTKGLLVRGHRVLPYCPRCGTVLSSHELALGYEEIKDKSIYVTFPLTDGTGRELVVWTTTPWTLPSNVAVAVAPDLEYGTFELRPKDAKAQRRKVILATARAEALAKTLDAELTLIGEPFPGKALEGLRYTRPLDVVPLPPDRKHSIVVTGDFVTAHDGSGIVHMAPAFGADDYEAGQKHGLEMLIPVAADGTFTGTTWPELEGKLVTADETNELIIRRLKADGRHLRTEQYVHEYPHCWRCKSKLIYYARDSWFVRTRAIKDRLVELNAGIDWHPPEVGTGRFGDWLRNNVDWALSRDRYWGTPLPVWVSDRDPAVVEVIGSYEELAARLGRPLPPDFDPHKPGVDQLTWPAPGGGTMRRAPEVIDAWFDSGAMPYAQWHYPFENKEVFERQFPADFICEGLDQTRGWFYSLLAISTAVSDRAAYQHVVVNGLLLDAQGKKMSKSLGNIVEPWELIQRHGADVARLYLLASSEVWGAKRYDPAAINELAGAFLQTLKNTYSFFQLYAGGAVPGAGRVARDAAGPLAPQPAGSHRRRHRHRVGGIRSHQRRAADHRVPGRSVQLVRPAVPLPVLGARQGGRAGGGAHAARCAPHREPPARAGGAVRQRLDPPRAHRRVGAPGDVPRARHPPRPRAGRGHGRGPPAGLPGARRPGREEHQGAAAARPDAGGAAPGRRRPPLPRHASAARAGGECARCRGGDVRRRSGAAARPAQLPRAGQAVRQAHPRCRRGGLGPHRGAAPGPRGGKHGAPERRRRCVGSTGPKTSPSSGR